jgi:tetratricopeptide (TPR) repeat protein
MMKLENLKLAAALSACAFVLASCATSQTMTTNDSTGGKAAEAALAEKSKTYKQSIHGVSENELKGGMCAHYYLQVKAKWDWKQAVEGANSCWKMKETARVEELGNMLATHDPSAPWGPYYLGLVAKQKGELERALWMTELALKRGSEAGVIHHLKGQILWMKKDYKGAVVSFERALELDSGDTAAHLFLGQVYFRDQDFSRASKHFYAVLKEEPRHTVALTGLAESQLRENNPQGALDAYTRLAEANPRDGQYLSRIGEIYETVLNDLPQALNTYRQLQMGARSGRITRNIDPQNDAKIRELGVTLNQSQKRSVASTIEEKGRVRK